MLWRGVRVASVDASIGKSEIWFSGTMREMKKNLKNRRWGCMYAIQYNVYTKHNFHVH